jgi:hypothetical protein
VRYIYPALLIVGMLPVAALLCWLAMMPGNRARRRGHPSARLITALGWISLVIWPLWFIAMTWSVSEPEWSPKRPRLHVPVSTPRPAQPARLTKARIAHPDDPSIRPQPSLSSPA